MKNSNWKVSVTSSANKNNLSVAQLDRIFSCYNEDSYQEFRNEIREKNKKYDKYPTAKWQLEKADSIEKMWHSNVKYTIDGDIIKADVVVEVDFPTEFDKDDVLNWVEGFNRLNQVYLMVQMKDIVAGLTVNTNENEFLEELTNNQKFDRTIII